MTVDTGFDAVIAGDVYKDETEITIGEAPPPRPHTCVSSTGERCDICFGPVTATVTEDEPAVDPAEVKRGLRAMVNLPPLTAPQLARLAREVAMEIKDLLIVLSDFGLTENQYEFLKEHNDFYRQALEAACLEWHSPRSTKDRLSIEAAAILEDSLIPLGARMQNEREGLPGVIEAAKFFAKIAGAGEREVGASPAGERFVINIDLGGGQKIVASTQPVEALPADERGSGDLHRERETQSTLPPLRALPQGDSTPAQVSSRTKGSGNEDAV